MANTEFATVVAACRSALNNQGLPETAVSYLQERMPEKVAGFVRQYLAEQEMLKSANTRHLSTPQEVADYRSENCLPSVSFIRVRFGDTYTEFSEKFVRDLEGLNNPFHLLNNLWSVARIAHTRKMSGQEGSFIRSVMNSTFMLLKLEQDSGEGLYGFNRRNKSGDFRNPAPFFRLTKKENPVAAIRSLDLFLDRDWCAAEGSLSESFVEAYEAALESFADDLMKDPDDLVDQDIRNVIYPPKKPKNAEGQSSKDASSEFGAKLGNQENALSAANTTDADADADADVGADADADDRSEGGQSEENPPPASSGDGEPDGSSSDRSPANQEEAS